MLTCSYAKQRVQQTASSAVNTLQCVIGHVEARWLARSHATKSKADDAALAEQNLNHNMPAVWEVVSSMSLAWKSSGPTLSLGELLWGSQALSSQHEQQAKQDEDRLNGTAVTDSIMLRELSDCMDLATAAYKKSRVEAAAFCKLKVHDIIAQRAESSYLAPGYLIAVDHTTQEVIWSIRGTRHGMDLLTDLASAHPYMQGCTHWGMHQAASWLLNKESTTIAGLLEQHPGYSLHLIGHSMGGGVAAIMAHMAHNEPAVWDALIPSSQQPHNTVDDRSHMVRATCFATPCIMSKDMALSCRPYVRSVILGDDLVPRLNITTINRLREEIKATDWRPQVAGLLGLQQYLEQYKQVTGKVSLTPRTMPSHWLSLAGLPADLRQLWPRKQQQANTPTADMLKADKAMQITDDTGHVKRVGMVSEIMLWILNPWKDLQHPSLVHRVARHIQPTTGTAGHPESGSCDEIENRQNYNMQNAAQSSAANHPANNENSPVEHAAPDQQLVGSDGQVTEGPQRAFRFLRVDSDLGGLGQGWKATVSAMNEKLREVRSLPLTVRQAIMRALDTPIIIDAKAAAWLQRLTSQLPAVALPDARTAIAAMSSKLTSDVRDDSRKSTDAGSAQSEGTTASVNSGAEWHGGVFQSDGAACDVTSAVLRMAASEPVSAAAPLYPAGQLYYIDYDSAKRSIHGVQHAGLKASHHRFQQGHVRVREIPADAPFFGRVLLTRSALQDHRCRAYRAALCAALGRQSTEPH